MDFDQVRKFVDGELPPDAAAEFERGLEADASLRAAVEFERVLRGRIAQHLSESAPTPEGLRSAVAATLAAAPGDLAPAPAGEGVARIFAGPTRANFFAVAACLLIVAGAVVVGMFGDEWGLGLRGPAQPAEPSDVNLAGMAATAVAAGQEHRKRMARVQPRDAEPIYESPELIREHLSDRLGAAVPIFDLSSAGVVLAGGRACSLDPLPDSTVQLVYEERGTGVVRGLSIFMQPNRGQFGNMESFLAAGKRYTPVDLEACAGEVMSMFTDGETIYIIRACYPGLLQAGETLVLRALAAGAGQP